MVSDSSCPFCHKSFKAGTRTTQSNINKHIKKMAKQADPDHPRVGTPAFEEIWTNRKFREVAPNEEARKQKAREKRRRWRLKKKEEDRAARLDAGPLDAEFELGAGLGTGLGELDMELDEMDELGLLDFEFRVEQEKPQAIDSHTFARIEFAFERLRYVTFQKLN